MPLPSAWRRRGWSPQVASSIFTFEKFRAFAGAHFERLGASPRVRLCDRAQCGQLGGGSMQARQVYGWSILVSLVTAIFTPLSAAAEPPEIVLYASDATIVQSAWVRTSGSGVAGGQYLSTVDNGWSS